MSVARSSHSEYERALEAYLSGRRDAVDRFLEGTRLTRTERALIEARLLNRGGDPRGALKLLARREPAEPFLSAEIAWVRSHCQNRLGANEQSIQLKLLAEELYRSVDDRRGRFLCFYNLSVDYSQLGYVLLEQHYLERAMALAEGASETALVHRARACILSKRQLWDEARQEVTASLKLLGELSPLDQQATQSVAADVLYRSGAHSESLEVLKELSRRSSSAERPRFESDRAFLQSLISGNPLKGPSHEVCRHLEFGLKWRLIQALQQGDRTRAEALFDQACATWGERFARDAQGDWVCRQESERCAIFWSLVESLRSPGRNASSPDAASESAHASSGKAGELLRVFEQSPMPLRKEELIEQLWGVSYDPSFDARFYKLIQRLKADLAREGRGQILVQNRAYRLSRARSASHPSSRCGTSPRAHRQGLRRMSGSQNSVL
jgi:hypothetical protein